MPEAREAAATTSAGAPGWTHLQLRSYREQGFLWAPGLIPASALPALEAAIPALLAGREEDDGMHREKETGGSVRQVYDVHRFCAPFRALVRDPRILLPVRQAIGGEVYIWHSKLNVKAPFEGTPWLWHQDFGYWRLEGVEPRLISVMVLLGRTTIHNGCLLAAAGSQRWGVQEHVLDTAATTRPQRCVDRAVLAARLREDDIVTITGETGDVLFFHCNLVHASGHNLSPLARRLFIAVYNDVGNRPLSRAPSRPAWVVSRDFEPCTHACQASSGVEEG